MAAPSAEILKLPQNDAPEWEGKLDLIRRTVAAGASADELDLYLYQARRSGLDPLSRQIHYIKRGGKGTIQVGIDGLRLIADRTGLYAGNDDAIFEGETEQGYPAKATVTVYKMIEGQRCAFSASSRWEEYYPGDSQGFQWRKMPHTMLAKTAEALALRKAFPADMSGLYVHEEMEQAGKPAPEPVAVLEGAPLAEAVQKAFAPEPESAPARPVPGVAPAEGKAAFGYVPVRWPLPKSFADPMTDAQRRMMEGKARERTIPEEDLPGVRRVVMEAYGLADDGSKANASLFIDWLINAEEESLDAAVAAVEATQAEAGEQLELEA